MKDLRANLPADVLDRFIIGYGVVFPDCDWSSDGAEWDPEMLADARRSRDLEAWLHNLFEYWHERDGRRVRPDGGDLERLQAYLRPEVDAPAAGDDLRLFEQVENARRRIEHLTDDQMRMAGRGRGQSTGALRGRRRHRQDIPRRTTGAALGRSRPAGGSGMSVSLVAALPRVPASHARTDGIAHRRRSP